MFKLKYHKKIRKDIKNFPASLKDIIRNESLKEIQKNPYKYKNLKGKCRKFKSYTFTYKGVSYRIIYKIIEKEKIISVYIIYKREEVYEKLIHRGLSNILGSNSIE